MTRTKASIGLNTQKDDSHGIHSRVLLRVLANIADDSQTEFKRLTANGERERERAIANKHKRVLECECLRSNHSGGLDELADRLLTVAEYRDFLHDMLLFLHLLIHVLISTHAVREAITARCCLRDHSLLPAMPPASTRSKFFTHPPPVKKKKKRNEDV